MARYLVDEYQDKQDRDMAAEISNWLRLTPRDIPHQQNLCDCGVFMVKFADFAVRVHLVIALYPRFCMYRITAAPPYSCILGEPRVHNARPRNFDKPSRITVMSGVTKYGLMCLMFMCRAGTQASGLRRRIYHTFAVAWSLRYAQINRRVDFATCCENTFRERTYIVQIVVTWLTRNDQCVVSFCYWIFTGTCWYALTDFGWEVVKTLVSGWDYTRSSHNSGFAQRFCVSVFSGRTCV